MAADSARRKPTSHPRKFSWCCSLTGHPPSPENPVLISKNPLKKSESVAKLISNSLPNSPLSSKSIVGRIDPRRILSPGRVSPIDSDPTIQDIFTHPSPLVESVSKSRSESLLAKNEEVPPLPDSVTGSEPCVGVFDVRLKVRGKRGGCLVLETSSEVLISNSQVFAGLISNYRKGLGSSSNNSNDSLMVCRIEVPDVENLGVFRDTIDLMFEDDITKRLLKIGVFRAIDILEVSVSIMFNKGVSSCLKYLEAVPWTEEEEEKLRLLFSVFKFDDSATQEILARLYSSDSHSQQNLSRQLVWSMTTCADNNARTELKSLVKGLLCQSSVYKKHQPELNKYDLYLVCQSCLTSLLSLLEEALGKTGTGKSESESKSKSKPLVVRISRQVDNLNWVIEILIEQQMCEEFVDIWTDQVELIKMHKIASPMVRYEISRVSATLFIAMGTRKLHCRAEARAGLLEAWFDPMLLDFGWLQRCKKGLDMKALEEALGQTLLTLNLKQQYGLFMEWFRCFSKHGSDCPNLSKAFQVWWRRSFLRGSESHAVESR